MDILSEILESNRLHAEVYLHSSFCGEWALESSSTQTATFHVVARGSCWLHISGSEHPEALRAGDLVVFPHNSKHYISNSEIQPSIEVLSKQHGQDQESGPSTSMICGYFKFADNRWNPLLDAMPPYLVIRSEVTSDTGNMNSLINFMIYEAESGQLGVDVVINRLSDVLFTHVVRTYIEQYKPEEGFIAALADHKLAKCLDAFHNKPGDNWSVESLAKSAGMSRSAFSEHFHHVTDQTPMQYVKQWRMQKAYDLLTTTEQSTQQIAEQCGYQSEASFSKLFKKFFSKGPGAVRKGK
jgi:AraC-like DNA-binding protein